MPPTLLQIAESIDRPKPTRWLIDIHHFASCLDLTVDQVEAFFKCIENGGSGVRKDGTWKANPKPFNTKTNLSSNEENRLNLHCYATGRKGAPYLFGEPSPNAVDYDSKYIYLGMVAKRRQEITLSIQRDIVKYIVGTHKTLTRSSQVLALRFQS